jgi:hypothetical protein
MLVTLLGMILGACGSKSSSHSTVLGLTARDEAAAAGLTYHGLTHGDDCVGDLNGDGFLDVLVNAHTDQWKLLYGSANRTFTPAPTQFSRRDRHGCAFADFNGDGRLDIYAAIGAVKGRGRNAKELWIQQPDHSFVDEASQWGIGDPGARGRAPLAINANGDKRPDLFAGAAISVDYPSLNKLWLNEGNKFVSHSGAPTSDLGENCAAAADLDHNGLDDIGICTPHNGVHVYRALGGGKYEEATASFGISPSGRRCIRFVDVNHDGWADLISVMQGRVTVQLNRQGHFDESVYRISTKDAQSAAVGDADGDGNPDLYVQMRDSGPDRVFLGDGTGHFTPGPTVPMRHGAGDSVTVLPHWRDGRDAFIVSNGYQTKRGDLQLITLVGNRTKST